MKPLLLLTLAALLAALATAVTVDPPEKPQVRQQSARASLPGSAPQKAALREAEMNPAAADRLLAQLHTALSGESRPVAIVRLRQMLDMEPQGCTGQKWAWDEVENGPAGIPGLRASLLNLLSRFSPADAAPFAESLLRDSAATPEDWTAAFHALLRDNGGGQHTAQLREQAARMLQREAWLTNPGPGLLDALRLMAVLGGEEEFVNLTELCGRGYAEGVELAAEDGALSIARGLPEVAADVLRGECGLLSRAPHVYQRLAAVTAGTSDGETGSQAD